MHENKTILIDNGQIILSIDTVNLPQLKEQGLQMDVLRLDKIHPIVSGNKWFKLKEYLREAADKDLRHLITFGGAWSNHIIAAAYAAREAGFSITGIIRGEKPAVPSATLQAAASYGMELVFISREAYKKKDDPVYLQELSARWPGSLIIPEGGAGEPGIRGSMDILRSIDSSRYTHVICAVGTGATYQGLVASAAPEQAVLGISVVASPYHFGGYARHTPELLDFINYWYDTTGIPTDFVYTGKLFYAVMEQVEQHLFPPDSRLLVIHSGGLQGNRSLAAGVLHF